MHRSAQRVLLAGLMLLLATAAPSAAFAGSALPPWEGAPQAQQEGRRVERADWEDHLPLAIGMALVVIAVDAVFVMKIMRDRRAERERREAAVRPLPGGNGYGPYGPGRS